MNINNILNNSDFQNDFYKFDAASTRPVTIKWGETFIHTITGPTPLIDISKSFNSNEVGVVESIVHSITLTGKIIKPASNPVDPNLKGITNVVSGITGLEDLFKKCEIATLEIECNNKVLYSASGVQVKNISFSKTSDNWVQSADYTIELEHKTAPTDDPNDQVEDRNDSWSIEPLDDTVYTNFERNVDQRVERLNPNRPVGPETSVQGRNFGSSQIQIFNIPQFRITRRLSAKGLNVTSPSPPPPPQSGCLSGSDAKEKQKKYFLNAKAWVDAQSKTAFTNSIASGSLSFATSPLPYDKTWLYNHTRTINLDIYNATYETNDTWIAMPTGIPYTETFTVEASTDEMNTKTVRVAGNIQGLSLTSISLMDGSKSPLPSAVPTPTNDKMLVDLSYSLLSGATTTTNILNISQVADVKSEKYLNALEAWIKDVKPVLYRRACLAINSSERVNPAGLPRPGTVGDCNPDPENPVFLKELLLSVIPNNTSEGHDPIQGTISYSHEFRNGTKIIGGTFSENIAITFTAPANNVQETQIIGRALGPLLFTAGPTNPRKSISIDIVVPKATGIKGTLMTESVCPMYYKGCIWNTVNQLILGHTPFDNRTNALFEGAISQQFGTVFKDSDTENWNPTEGRYSRSVSWIFQQCTTNRFYHDH